MGFVPGRRTGTRLWFPSLWWDLYAAHKAKMAMVLPMPVDSRAAARPRSGEGWVVRRSTEVEDEQETGTYVQFLGFLGCSVWIWVDSGPVASAVAVCTAYVLVSVLYFDAYE
jgi:hypothetical protein